MQYVPKGKFLVDKDPTFEGAKNVDSDLLYEATKIRSNRRVLIPKLYLQIYNFGRQLENDKRLRKIYNFLYPNGTLVDSIAKFIQYKVGEPPSILDTQMVNKDIRNLKSVYFSYGYFTPEITAKYKKIGFDKNSRRVQVIYSIKENEPYIIDSLTYKIDNFVIQSYLQQTKEESYLKVGEPYNEENFTKERDRVAKLMREIGFFKFSPNYIHFTVDSTYKKTEDSTSRDLHVEMIIKGDHQIYKVDSVNIFIRKKGSLETDNLLSFSSKTLNKETRKLYKIPLRRLNDTLDFHFETDTIVPKELNLNLLSQLIYFKKGDVYNLNNSKKTQNRLQNLGIFSSVLIRFSENDSFPGIIPNIELIMYPRYGIKYGAEAFQTQDRTINNKLNGLGLNISFHDKNIFKFAERFELGVRGNMSFLVSDELSDIYYEYGINSALIFNKFFLPFPMKKDLSDLKPQTKFGVSFESERRTQYSRKYTTGRVDYIWNNKFLSKKTNNKFTPLKLLFIDSDTINGFTSLFSSTPYEIRNFILQDFLPHTNISSEYALTVSDYGASNTKTTNYYQGKLVLGGFLASLANQVLYGSEYFKQSKFPGNVLYSRYVKLSIEAKKRIPIGKSFLVGRIFAGWAAPLKYSRTLLLEDKFFAGGTNSMRAWQSNLLGPGTISQSSSLGAVGGEYSFEANLELRRKVSKYVELAAFAEAGNVWLAPNKNQIFFDQEGNHVPEDDDKAKFNVNNLQVGIDAGIGIRFDFSFLILRLDVGQQIYAPDIQDFVLKNFFYDIGGNRMRYNFGIGYPF